MKKMIALFLLQTSWICAFTLVNDIDEGAVVLVGYSKVENRSNQPHKIVELIRFEKKGEKVVQDAPKNVFDTHTQVFETAGLVNSKGGFVSISYYPIRSDFAKDCIKKRIKIENLSYDQVRKESAYTVKYHKGDFDSVENLSDPNTKIILAKTDGIITTEIKLVKPVELKQIKERKKIAEQEEIGVPKTVTDDDWDELEIDRAAIARPRSTVVPSKKEEVTSYEQRAAAIERAKAESRKSNE